jgi:hypothetical protein
MAAGRRFFARVFALLAFAGLHHASIDASAAELMAPMGELMAAHLKTLADFPPVQGGKSFDMSNVIEDFVKKGNP